MYESGTELIEEAKGWDGIGKLETGGGVLPISNAVLC